MNAWAECITGAEDVTRLCSRNSGSRLQLTSPYVIKATPIWNSPAR